ncbi:MAG: DUF1294 domain-containing protein [Bacillus sp. (in: firmicutes)]
MGFVWIYFGVVNIIGICIMGFDKQKAKKGKYRISEARLWLVALIGGACGSTLGMFLFRHKTKHINFRWGLPALSLLDLLVMVQFL